MRDGDDGALVGTQVLFQPGDRFGVQVVGGLVQQQDVGFGQQQAGQGHAAAFTAGEHLDRRICRRAAQGVHGQLQVAVQVPGVHFVEGLLQAGLFGDQGLEIGIWFGKSGIDLVELRQHIGNGLDGFRTTSMTVFSWSSWGSCSSRPTV